MPQLKLGNIQVIFPLDISQFFAKNCGRIINTKAAIWCKICSDISLPLDITCSSKLTVFLELCSWTTVHFSEQNLFREVHSFLIMSVDKIISKHIFTLNRGYCLFIIMFLLMSTVLVSSGHKSNLLFLTSLIPQCKVRLFFTLAITH